MTTESPQAPKGPAQQRSRKLKDAPIKRDIRFTQRGWKLLGVIRAHYEKMLGHPISYSFTLDRLLHDLKG